MKDNISCFHPLFLTHHDRLQLFHALSHPLPNKQILSINLGKTEDIEIILHKNIMQTENKKFPLPSSQLLNTDERTILIYDGQRWRKWEYFDEYTQKFYKMVFVGKNHPPTVEISGIKMHVTKDGNPALDTENKIKAFHQLSGILLDTCIGLGYTAIRTAQNPGVKKVFTCESDMNIIKICRENPWSQQIFQQKKIIPIICPVQDFIRMLPEKFIDYIIHDPPRFSLSPELYIEKLYTELYRILRKKGELYHYTGDPNKKRRKQPLWKSTITLLKKVGFRRVKQTYQGVWAQK
jgi:predicted methyltransferase